MPYYRDSDGKIKRKKLSMADVFEKLQNENVKFVDLQFTDVPGKSHHVTVPTHTLNENSFSIGIPKLDGSSIRGFTGIDESDMLLKPDPSSFVVIPWSKETGHIYARLICSVHWGQGHSVHKGGPLDRDPRCVAKKSEEYLKQNGFDVSYWGPELEFFVFDSVTWDTDTPASGQSYCIKSNEAAWQPGGYKEFNLENKRIHHPIRHKEGYFPLTPQDTLMDFRNDVVSYFENDFGIIVDAHHHEVATAGQCEINMLYDSLVNQADSAQTFKYVVKNVAFDHNQVATFMPKPLAGDNGSGMHVHQSLWKDGKNTFYDENDAHAQISQTARYYIGGIMAHTQSLAAIVAPTTNSYKRLVPGFEAPVYIAWSKSNRSANVRIPVNLTGNESAKRIEFRCPDPAANPYLAFSAMLCAGLDGIKNQTDCGDPVDENIYLLSAQQRSEKGIKELPKDLGEAADALETDNEFLKPVFSDSLLDTILERARDEHFEIAQRTHPHEFQLYFDVG